MKHGLSDTFMAEVALAALFPSKAKTLAARVRTNLSKPAEFEKVAKWLEGIGA